MKLSRTFGALGLTALAIAAVVIGISKPAAAQQAQICTFTSDPTSKINYSDGLTRDDLTFSWNNSTGAVTAASWYHDGVTYSLNAAGTNAVDPNFDPVPNQVQTAFSFYVGSGPAPFRLNGILARRIPYGEVSVAGIYSGTSTAWMGGYGTVSCQ